MQIDIDVLSSDLGSYKFRALTTTTVRERHGVRECTREGLWRSHECRFLCSEFYVPAIRWRAQNLRRSGHRYSRQRHLRSAISRSDLCSRALVYSVFVFVVTRGTWCWVLGA